MKKSSFILGTVMGIALTVTGTLALSPPPEHPFKDIPSDHWALFNVMWVKDSGIMKGYEEDDTFRGDNPTTRYELATVLSNYDDVATDNIAAMEKRMKEYNAYNYDPFPIMDQKDILDGAEVYQICKSKEDSSRVYMVTNPLPDSEYKFFNYRGVERSSMKIEDVEGCLLTTKDYFDSKIAQ